MVNILLLVKQAVDRRCFPNGLTSVYMYKEVISRVLLLHKDSNDQRCWQAVWSEDEDKFIASDIRGVRTCELVCIADGLVSVYCMPHSSVARKEKLPYDASAYAHVGKGTGRIFDQIKTHCTLLLFLIFPAVKIPSSQNQYAWQRTPLSLPLSAKYVVTKLVG